MVVFLSDRSGMFFEIYSVGTFDGLTYLFSGTMDKFVHVFFLLEPIDTQVSLPTNLIICQEYCEPPTT